MSSFDAETAPGKGNLTVDAPLGVAISITNGPFEEVASGFRHLSMELPEGIYTIRWHTGTKTSQQMVRLTSGANVEITYNRVPDMREAEFLRSLISSASDNETGLVIVVSHPSKQRYDHLERVFSLRSARDNQLMQSDFLLSKSAEKQYTREADGIEDTDVSYSALSFRVGPGTYFLKYRTVEQLSVEQTVNIFPQRITVGILKAAKASRPERDRDQTRFRAREGVDPCGTKFLSFSPIDEDRFEEILRLSRMALHTIITLQDNLDPTIPQALNAESDPYLLTYVTAIRLGTTILAAIAEGGMSRTPNEVFHVSAEAADVAQRLISYIPEYPGLYNPDTLCAQWRLSLGGWGNVPYAFADLKAPPLLDRSWRWATAWSVENPGTTLLPKSVLAAANAKIAAPPWMVWRRGGSETVETLRPDLSKDLVTNMVTLAETLGSGRGSDYSNTSMKSHKGSSIPNLDLGQLSSGTSRLAADIIRLGGSSEISSLLAQKLAVVTNTPATILAGQVEKALNEISGSDALEELPDDLLFYSDPHKNKFGSSPVRSDREVLLESIEPSNNSEILALTIVVHSLAPDRPLQGTVKFFLHPTFNPSVEIVRVIDGRAVLACYAMGGFTMGVETSDGVKLELDLSLDQRLPDWFRDR